MNSLVGLGAVTSFAAGTASWLMPDGVFDVSFLEEPVMLLAFVLLGRALESRARLQASGASQRPAAYAGCWSGSCGASECCRSQQQR